MAANISAAVPYCQQRRFWTGQHNAISVAAMKPSAQLPGRRAKPTAADKEAAGRLLRLWNEAKAERATTDSPLTQEVAGAELDVNQSAVSQYLNGLIPLNYRAVKIFARLLDVDPSEIRSDLPEQAFEADASSQEVAHWENIVGYAQAVGLGAGAEAEEYAETHKLKFRVDSLRRKGLRPGHLVVYYGRGDSMEPRIKDGDAILFDTSDLKPRDGAIFIVRRGREILAKRCEIIDDTVFFRSDNAAGDHNWKKPRRLDSARDPLEIIGRVRWIGSWE